MDSIYGWTRGWIAGVGNGHMLNLKHIRGQPVAGVAFVDSSGSGKLQLHVWY